ncbi:MAG: alternative ribosome rescue aminoacyl-tRNA hydrolase ArfB [Nitrospirota bacterium]
MIPVTDTLALDDRDIELRFIRSSGPGGQHVNKAATAVQLRFDAAHSASLSEEVRQRLMRLAGKRLTGEGVLVIEASRYRTQEQNRQDALARLVMLLRKAMTPPKQRRKTAPSRASREQRLVEKRRRSAVKGLRGAPRADEQ